MASRCWEIRKSYAIAKADDPGTKGYEVGIESTFNNLTDAPMTLQTDFNGPVLPPGESNRSPDRQVVGGYLEGSTIILEAHPVRRVQDEHQQRQHRSDEGCKAARIALGGCNE